MNGAKTEPELNKINAESNAKIITKGINHHFFSFNTNIKHSFSRFHIFIYCI